MNSFLSGVTMMGCWVASLFYLRFWKTTRDRLFLIFSGTFFMLGVDRIALELTPTKSDSRPLIFLIRLSAFLVLIWGILDKNFKQKNR